MIYTLITLKKDLSVKMNKDATTLRNLIDVPLRLFFWGENSCATALFDGSTFNENLMVLLRTILVLKDILLKIQF